MVVQASRAVPSQLDLAYVALFLGLRVNELVMERMARAGFRGVRESHGYLIQHVIACERSITELASRMEVTQQAASKAVAELIGLGILEAVTGKDRRVRRIRLSRRGWEAVWRARRTRERIGRRLAASVGEQNYGKAKAILLTCLQSLGGMERIRSRRIRSPR
jgi:DNA-binding MarR family transcriptional regulator